MIAKGNQRGGGRQLATHLLNALDNEGVEIAELRGAIAPDLHGAFHEWHAQAQGTKAVKYLYSLSINPDGQQKGLTREQYLDYIARVEKSIGLIGQPRAVVFHTKKGREHAHVVWSRIDTDKMRAVQISHDRQKLRTVAQQFARDYGLELPDGMQKNGRSDRYEKRQKTENLAEKQQEERSGEKKEVRVKKITQAWKDHSDPALFVQALEQQGYLLARGDGKRGKPGTARYMIVDRTGERYSLYRQIEGIKAAQIKGFLGALYPLVKLPHVDTLRDRVHAQPRPAPTPETVNDQQDRRRTLEKRQEQRRAPLLKAFAELGNRHDAERRALADLLQSEKENALTDRAARQPKGLRAFVMRITGLKLIADARHRRDDATRATIEKRQKEALQGRHDRELLEAYRRLRDLRALELRETRSLDNAFRRESFAPRRAAFTRAAAPDKPLGKPAQEMPEPPIRFVPFDKWLKPDFNQAAAPNDKTATTGGLQEIAPLKPIFTRAAQPDEKQSTESDKPPEPEKLTLSLIEAFRKSIVKPTPEPEPVKPDPAAQTRLDEARRALEDIRRRPSKSRDRGRDR